MINRIFFHPSKQGYILFTGNVLEHMYSHIQSRFWQKEAGGEIYTTDINNTRTIVSVATGPNRTDRRTRNSFNPDPEAATQDRYDEFLQGRHAVGIWHTHPEPGPNPSTMDRRTTEQYLDALKNDRTHYLLVILGNRGNPPNMTVWSVTHSKPKEWTEFIEVSSEC